MELVTRFEPPHRDGVMVGSRITVPEGQLGLVVRNKEPLDVLPPGEHPVDAISMQRLAEKGNLALGRMGPIDAAIYMCQQAVQQIPWACVVLYSSTPQLGFTYGTIEGSLSISVEDPNALYLGVYRDVAAGEPLSSLEEKVPGLRQAVTKTTEFAHSHFEHVAEQMVLMRLEAFLSKAVSNMPATPDQLSEKREPLTTETRKAMDEWCCKSGLKLTDLTVERISAPQRPPCVKCGSQDKAVTYGVFKRHFNFLILRQDRQLEGNFCSSCSVNVGMGFSVATLLLGPWGIPGVVMAPWCIALNVKSMARVLSYARK